MVELTQAESKLVTQLLDGLIEAIAETPDVELEYANKTKIQKLLYFAVEEFDIPITYSWYLAGAVVPDRSIGPGALDGPESAPTGPSGPSIDAPGPKQEADTDDSSDDEPLDPILFGSSRGESSEPHGDLEAYVSREELLDFYVEEIPDVWHEQTMRFLQNFYHEVAPEEYRLLYIESTHLRTNLSELAETVESHLDGEPPARPTEALRKSIELSISDLHYYLRQDDDLRTTFDVVVEGTDLLEDAIMMLDQTPPEDLNGLHLECLEDLQDFFYYYVWKYPCLLISQQTAIGPQAEELRAERATEFETFDETVREKQAELAAKLSRANLLPGANDYPPVEDKQLSETLTDLSAEYLE